MAQLARLAPSQPPGRISQLLPTVKCSNCGVLVPLSELGDHQCPPPVPVPKLPPASRSPSSLLPARLQNLTSTPARSYSPLSTSSVVSHESIDRRGTSQGSQKPVVPASNVPVPLARLNSPAPTSQGARPPPVQPAASFLAPAQDRPWIPAARSGSTPPAPSRDWTHSPIERPRTSSASAAQPRDPYPAVQPSPLRSRAASNATMSSTYTSSTVRPSNARPSDTRSISSRSHTDSVATSSTAGSQYEPARRPSVEVSQQRPRIDSYASSVPPQQRPRIDSYASSVPPQQRPRVDSYASTVPPQQRPRIDSYASSVPPQSPMFAPRHEPEPDTKTGGAAGMAGVGRRGFAAAARAAMLASSAVNGWQNAGTGSDYLGPPPSGMDGRRANAPRFLDIDAAVNLSPAVANTPPLSPNSGHSSHTPSPLFHSPISPNGSDPRNAPPPAIASSRSPSPKTGAFSPQPESKSPTTPVSAVRLPFFEKYKNNLPGTVATGPLPDQSSDSKPESSNPLMSPKSESSFEGLAYADSLENESQGPMSPPTASKSPVPFPTVQDDPRGTPVKRPRAPSGASVVTSGSGYSRPTSKSTGGLDRAMETLFEDATTTSSASTSMRRRERNAGAPSPHRSNTVPGPLPISPPAAMGSFPRRSRTSPNHGNGTRDKEKEKDGRATETKRRVRTCIRCSKRIDDGRWIQMDGGSVLCERCWKNMYLPKCRRCNLPIEKQAVSSSDGQLKGKYHRDCFNCHVCHKPFPDKTFYVYDGKPLCGYHYHEANNSLCAAPSCGQPIEGPCAVAHNGDHYHPAHLLCEWPGGCRERLEEYWEVDGRMLCERHVNAAEQEDDDDDADERRALKRVTRFIDLGDVGGSDLL